MKYGKLNVNEKLKKLNVSVSSFFPPYYKCSGLSAILQPIPFLVTCRDLLCLTFPFHLCFVVTKIKSFIHSVKLLRSLTWFPGGVCEQIAVSHWSANTSRQRKWFSVDERTSEVTFNS